MSKKLTYEQVKSIIESRGYILISDRYIKNMQKLIIKDFFGYVYFMRLVDFQNTETPRKVHRSNPYTIDNIKMWLRLNNKPFVLLSDNYIKANEKLRWQCLEEHCGEIFETSWDSISSNHGCGYCDGKRVGLSNSLATKYPDVSKEWHPTKNGKITPYDITAYSSKIVWWVCINNHEWQADVNSRTRQRHSCAICSGNKVYTIEEVRHILMEKNLILLEENYKNIKQKLKISNKDGYLFFSTLASIKENNVKIFHPANPYVIYNINLWAKINNKPFMLLDQIYKNNSQYLEWQCLSKKCGNSFKSTWGSVYANGGSCPYCNSLELISPQIASEWHPTLNSLTPLDVQNGSKLTVWWQCTRNNAHFWKATICNRTVSKSGCPYCCGKLASDDYNLFVNNIDLCKEWDYSKNKNMPTEYTPHSTKKVWWKCKECEYEWEASIGSRNGKSKSGCPNCSASKGEILIYQYLDKNNIVNVRHKMFDNLLGVNNKNLSYDFYLPNINLLIEYQGEYHDGDGGKGNYHMTKNLKRQQEHDRRKRDYAKNHNINLLEIWYWDFDRIEEILDKELKINP